MEQRLDFYKANPHAIKAMLALEERIGKSDLEKSLTELVRLRASQINGCAFCVDMHTTDARKGGETDRRLATVVVWRETPFFTARERAALEWTEAVGSSEAAFQRGRAGRSDVADFGDQCMEPLRDFVPQDAGVRRL